MITVVLRVLSIFALLGIGFFLKKRGVFTKEAVGNFTSLLLMASVPALNFSSVASETFDSSKLQSIIEVSVGILIYYFGALIISFLIARKFKCNPPSDAGMLMVVMTAINCAFMGFPITKSIFGDDYLFYMVLINALSSLYVFFLINFHFNYKDKNTDGINIKRELKTMFNFPFIATIAGFILFFVNVRLPEVFLDFCSILGSATTPVSMIVIGIQLADIDILSLIKDKYLLISSFVKLIAFPTVALIIVMILPVSTYAKVVLPLGICFPTATITTSVAHKYKKNEYLMAKGVAITTLFSVVTVSIWCIILSTLFI